MVLAFANLALWSFTTRFAASTRAASKPSSYVCAGPTWVARFCLLGLFGLLRLSYIVCLACLVCLVCVGLFGLLCFAMFGLLAAGALAPFYVVIMIAIIIIITIIMVSVTIIPGPSPGRLQPGPKK